MTQFLLYDVDADDRQIINAVNLLAAIDIVEKMVEEWEGPITESGLYWVSADNRTNLYALRSTVIIIYTLELVRS